MLTGKLPQHTTARKPRQLTLPGLRLDSSACATSSNCMQREQGESSTGAVANLMAYA